MQSNAKQYRTVQYCSPRGKRHVAEADGDSSFKRACGSTSLLSSSLLLCLCISRPSPSLSLLPRTPPPGYGYGFHTRLSHPFLLLFSCCLHFGPLVQYGIRVLNPRRVCPLFRLSCRRRRFDRWCHPMTNEHRMNIAGKPLKHAHVCAPQQRFRLRQEAQERWRDLGRNGRAREDVLSPGRRARGGARSTAPLVVLNFKKKKRFFFFGEAGRVPAFFLSHFCFGTHEPGALSLFR